MGTEGTLAVVLQATVRLVEAPAATALTVLGYPDMPASAEAVPALLPHAPVALEGMDASFTRASASLRCDLATSMLAQHDHDEARRHAAAGRALARRAGSVRQRRRLDALRLSA